MLSNYKRKPPSSSKIFTGVNSGVAAQNAQQQETVSIKLTQGGGPYEGNPV